MANKTAAGLVAYAKKQLGKPYWYGTYGNKPTEDLLNRKAKQYPYPKYFSYRPDRMPMFRAQIGKFDRVHDCVGLIKGYLWSDTPTSAPKYNAAQDKSANGMRAVSNASKNMSSMPDTPGLLVFSEGHVGVYIGGGQVIEARGSDSGVVQTVLKSRGWTHWGRCPWIQYPGTQTTQKPEAAPENKPEYITHTMKPGDTLWALASKHLGSGTRWTELAKLNNITDEKKIPVGKVIKIPKEK